MKKVDMLRSESERRNGWSTYYVMVAGREMRWKKEDRGRNGLMILDEIKVVTL